MPLPASSLDVCLSLVHAAQLHYPDFLCQSRSPHLVCTCIFMEAYLVPFSLFSDYHSLFPSLDLFLIFLLFVLFHLLVPPSHQCLSEEMEKSYVNVSSSHCLSAPVMLCLCPLPLHSQFLSSVIVLLVPFSLLPVFPLSQHPHSPSSPNCLLVLHLQFFLLSLVNCLCSMIGFSIDPPSSSHCSCQVGSNPPLPVSCSFPLTASATISFFPFPHFIHALCILITFSFLCCLGVSTE